MYSPQFNNPRASFDVPQRKTSMLFPPDVSQKEDKPMTVSELKQLAYQLQSEANRGINCGERGSLEVAWREVDNLFTKARSVLGNRAAGFTPVDSESASWERVRELTTNVMLACDVVEPTPSAEIPGDYP
jgi:hypothetical protein